MYAIGRRVYCSAEGYESVGEVTEANWQRDPSGKRHAVYVVTFKWPKTDKTTDLMCGPDVLRGADYCCDSCGEWRTGLPHRKQEVVVFGEVDDVFSFCFLCSGPPARDPEAAYAEEAQITRAEMGGA